MGRYAFFNTGIEYKFAFATQESSDITMFGGRPGDKPLTWSWLAQRDLPKVVACIEYLQSLLGLSKGVDIEAYEKTADGTQSLLFHIHDSISEKGLISLRYLLGCAIYHQLLYRQELEAEYEA